MLRKTGILLLLIFGFQTFVNAQVKLPKLINDHMVLQRDTELTLWGWASPGEEVQVEFAGFKRTTTTQPDSTWQVQFPPQEAGGPYEVTISGSNTITLKNIMLGDVWVASGQSNMELPMYRVAPLYEEEMRQADYPRIRYFNVPQRYNFDKEQQDLAEGSWQIIHPDVIRQVSALAYFFARRLHEEYEVPVGIINSSLGGSPVEAWMSEEALKEFPRHYHEALRYKNDEMITNIQAADQSRMNTWFHVSNTLDKGYDGIKWSSPELDDSKWGTVELPGFWDEAVFRNSKGKELKPGNENGTVHLKGKNGVVWYRKTIEVPESMTGMPVELELGRIVDADSTFINGVFVGNTTYQYPPRWYTVPAGILKADENVIAVRVVNQQGAGGFFHDKPYELRTDTDTLNLEGRWKYKLGIEMPPLASQTFIRWKPLGLFNGMIAPLLNFEIKGVIWYQGESNVGDEEEYAKSFPAMISNWRNRWELPELPFLYVQLANFMKAYDKPTDSEWARLREAQAKALEMPYTGMAVAIDVGEWNDIHPLNKKSVGERLAQAARHVAYGEQDVVPMGPVYAGMEKKGSRIEISFKNTGSGLIIKGESLKEIAIAGPSGEFEWARADVQGDKLIVWHPAIENPVAVRYAWADNPDDANLYNQEGLPAAPFRTDSW
ncbi:sialate O-acetylesterase [Gracilimonas mengyeensis]|uniref:Sialate O-acetylesterase n=1 Tax=Gracilimonas mengyeensis TaxID=1302730 RepID=A0A521AF94_9BACT|nr:sialate O-acetylesterase [Gracilimonas mengyeensis]SMO33446.1 sialate O-acetylesterase [Gracilimonas mengyeensis]